MTPITSEPGMVVFKVDGLQCQVFTNQQHMQSLHIKITQLPPVPTPDNKQPYQWSAEDLQILEQFFELRVATAPFRPNALSSFGRMLNCPPQVLKDFIQIIRLEFMPELLPGTKWHIQFCMRVPPSAAPIVPIGSPSVHICKFKFLFFVQLTRIPYVTANGVMDWKDTPSMVLPVIYDVATNITQLAEKREPVQSMVTTAASNQLRRFSDFGSIPNECSLFPAIRDLMINLALPNEPTPPPSMAGQIIPSPVGSSPGPMTHSPQQPPPQQQQPQTGPAQQQPQYPMGPNQN